MEQTSKQNKRWIWIGILLVIGIAGFLVISNWAAIGTSLANPMRKLLGVERVAQMESALFNAQDSLKQWQYRLGIGEPQSRPGKSSIIRGALPTPVQSVSPLLPKHLHCHHLLSSPLPLSHRRATS